MKRREFVGAVGVAGLAAARLAAAAEAEGKRKQILELRLYQVDAGPKRERLDAFLREAAVPAWNRLGIQNVGVFEDTEEQGTKLRKLTSEATEEKGADLAVLLAHGSLEAFATATDRLLADAAFEKAGAAWLDLPKQDPLYQRIETWLMLAFDGCPKVEVATKRDSRLFQLRRYESHSLHKAKKKVEMFNAGGEIALFRQCGVNPVFFGEVLAGARMPTLVYMLGFDDKAAQDAAWAKFRAHPEWKRLSGLPVYRDTVSNITNLILRPTPYSRI